MLLSISLILIVGMSMAWLCQRLRLPGLMGMLATGMILGPYALDPYKSRTGTGSGGIKKDRPAGVSHVLCSGKL